MNISQSLYDNLVSPLQIPSQLDKALLYLDLPGQVFVHTLNKPALFLRPSEP